MLTLPNGVQFNCIASAGSRGWAGNDEGHGFARGWKWPWSKLWPHIHIVKKTLTSEPRAGNLTFWRPWRCVRPIPGSRWGGYDDYGRVSQNELDRHGSLSAVHRINTLPWPANSVGPGPLARYALVVGVVGRPLVPYARMALRHMQKHLPQVPVISGGGV